MMSTKRTGIYFMMLTFAFNQMIYYLAYSWHSVTGGEDGLGHTQAGHLHPASARSTSPIM